MPRFFDDYSNTYLTHDSSAGRKQQRRGWKFRENFKLVRYRKNNPVEQLNNCVKDQLYTLKL